MDKVRTRFAPSPTGYIHVGGIRTALFAWLLARHNDGVFILRLEDTDQKREVEGAKQHIITSLKELGLDYDEGPDQPGEFGPYIQSERLDIYKKWANKLIDSGRAYADPYTASEVETLRNQARANKQPFLYRNHRPNNPPSWDGSQPLRFMSQPKPYNWTDLVMGEMHSGPEVIDDFVIIKSDGYPTYNFAHIIDDYEMQISHVLRGQEFLSSVPNYLNLSEALDIKLPNLATLPHVLNPTGNKKLSKRDGAKDVLDYIKQGYLSEALISFIATLGWNDGTEQEIYSTKELINSFSLDRVQKSGARFDEKRLEWINGSLIRKMDTDQILKKSRDFWPSEAQAFDDDYKMKVLSLLQERIKYFAELPQLSKFFFVELPVDSTLIDQHKQLSKLSKEELSNLLISARESLKQSDFSLDDITNRLNDLLVSTDQKPVILFSLIRIATTQSPFSPALFDTLHLLGKDEVIKRLDHQLASL